MAVEHEAVWLIAATARGDVEAFERLYAATRARVHGVLLRILRNKDLAEEALQQTYVEVWRRAAAFNPRLDTPMAWIIAFARAHAFSLVRRAGAQIEKTRPTDHPAEGPAEPVTPASMSEGLRRVLACLGRVEEEQRRAILLAYYNGWTREQLAQTFATTPEMIKARLRVGLLHLRDGLGA